MLKKIKNILLYRSLEGKDITYDTAKKIIKKRKGVLFNRCKEQTGI